MDTVLASFSFLTRNTILLPSETDAPEHKAFVPCTLQTNVVQVQHKYTRTHPRPIKVNDTSEYLKPTAQQTLSPSWNFRGCRQHPVMEHVCSLNCDKSRP